MTQEEKITFILLNFMALEGAQEHFGVPSPSSEPFEVFKKRMQDSYPPKKWKMNGEGYYPDPEISDALEAFHYSWLCLKRIRNNLFHANKAREPDTLERLEFLLDWSVKFIKGVYETNEDMAQRALAIKKLLKITSV